MSECFNKKKKRFAESKDCRKDKVHCSIDKVHYGGSIHHFLLYIGRLHKNVYFSGEK